MSFDWLQKIERVEHVQTTDLSLHLIAIDILNGLFEYAFDELKDLDTYHKENWCQKFKKACLTSRSSASDVRPLKNRT